MYLLNLAWLWSLALWLQVCQHLPHGLKCSYVSQELLKKLVHGTLIEAEILTSPLPHVFAQLGLVYGCKCSAHWYVKHLPSGLKMYLCVTATSRKCLVHWAIIEAEMLTSPFPIYLLNLARFLSTSTLPIGVSTPCRWSEIFLCVSETSKNHLVHGAPNRSWDIDLPTPHVFAQLSPVLVTGTLPTGVLTPAKWSKNVSMCHRNLQKMFGAWDHNRSWDIDLPTPHIFA